MGFLRRSRTVARAIVRYHEERNPRNKNICPCVSVMCLFTGHRVGPIWGHSTTSVRRALAELTSQCPCRRRFHKARAFEGRRVPTGG